MKLLTYQPESIMRKLQKGTTVEANAVRDYSECSAENLAFRDATGFDPIWCIPIFDDIQSVYNVVRCSPSFPQSAILVEKPFEEVVFINYTKYSECLRAKASNPDIKVDFKQCIQKGTEEEFKARSIYFECIIPNIHPKEVRGTQLISKLTDPDALNSALFDLLHSDKINELLKFDFKLKQPKDPIRDGKAIIAWRALLWHKLVDYCAITDDTTRYSFEQFKQFCIQLD